MAVHPKTSEKKPTPAGVTGVDVRNTSTDIDRITLELRKENEALHSRLKEAEEALGAIRRGEVDALLVSTNEGEKVFTLKGAEYPYRVVIEQMLEGAANLAEDGTILYCNQSFARLLRIPLETIIGQTIQRYILDSDRERFSGLLQRSTRTGCCEAICLKAQGNAAIPVLLSITPLQMEESRVFSVVVTDLTELKRAEAELHTAYSELEARVQERTVELTNANAQLQAATDELEIVNEALQKSEHRFKLALTNSPTVLFHQDSDLRYTWIYNPNPGFSGTGTLGKTDNELLPSEDATCLTDIKRHVLKTGSGTRAEVRTTIDGIPFYYDLTVEPLIDEHGKTVGIMGVSHDITQRKRAEEILQEREQTLQSILRAAPIGIGLVSNRVLLQVNNRFCQMTGYSENELIGQNARILYPTEAEYEHVGREKYAQILKNGLGAVETRWRHKNGTVFDILLSSSPIDLANPYEDVIFVALDITPVRKSEKALKEYAENLKQSNEDLERFAYVSSHDLQEPVRMVTSYAQLLARRYKGQLDSDADEFIGYIEQGGKRMHDLINDLLEYSRVSTRQRPLARTEAEAVLKDALENLHISIQEHGVTITHDALPQVIGDAVQLRQVFSNLISNAIKFRKPNVPPDIHISAQKNDEMVQFSIRDNGIGIEPQYREKIFVIFQRLHPRNQYEGTGIGLAIVKRIVERHGGRIWVDSEPGKGSTFHFTIPAAR
jgi:PAS domain S-box-containing protein